MKTYITIILIICTTFVCKSQCTLQDPCFSIDITATTAYLGQFANVRVTIDDANNDDEITNPLIVVEGFDTGRITTPENPEGQTDYDDFRNFVNFSFSNDLRDLIWANNKDYDIIYVDWDNGLDYLQRNAYALQEVINWVNTQKTGNEPNVVLGQSMGGVIARWALADMEENSIDHETRLFISHDAPQQGASIPLALQFMYRHITNLYIDVSQTLGGNLVTIPIAEQVFDASSYLSLLNVPATKQLLQVRSTLNYTGDNTEHHAFYNELVGKGLNGSGGYPVNCRNIALSNGSECGETQNLNPGENLFRLYSDTKLSFLEDLASLIVLPVGGFLGGVLVNENLFNVGLLGLVPGNSRFNIHFWGKAMTYTSGAKIYNGNISYSKRVLWLGPTIVTQITQVEKNQFNNMLPFDYYGGGFYNVSNAIDINNLPSELSLANSFNFIPTTSALDIGNDQVSLFDSDYLRSYVGELPPIAPKDTPFDNFSTEYDINPNANSNQQHISFNTRSGDWLAAELVATSVEYTNCAFTCSTAEIAGPDRFCSGSRTYNAPLGGDTYLWSIEGNAAFIQSGATSNSVTIAKTQLIEGDWVTLIVDITSERCGSNSSNPATARLSKPIYIGVPTYEFIEEVNTLETGLPDPIAPIGSCDDLGFKLNIAPSNQEILEVEWEKITTNYEWSHADDEYVIITPACNEPIEFRVRFRNNCGWSSWQNITYDITQCSSNCSGQSGNITSNAFVIFPVPADTSLTIKLKNEPVGLLQNGDTLNIKLFNSSGWLVNEVNAVATQTTLDVSSLVTGIYTLVLNYNGQIESHQIIIN